MSTAALPAVRAATPSAPSARWFVGAAGLLALLACILAGWSPISFSIVTVFLFAGPHNWMEGRYFLAKMPGRWGALTAYFTTGIAGTILLAGASAALTWIVARSDVSTEFLLDGLALWNTALVVWIVILIQMRSRQNPRRHWPWVWPAALLIVALAWYAPLAWDLALVYLHPLVALWFLDRELKAQRPTWRPAYHAVLALVPALLALLTWRLWSAPDLPGADTLSVRITEHAGAGILSGVSTHFLVAAHTFLEMLHYGVWLLAIPLVGMKAAPWQIGQIPLARRSRRWLIGLSAFLLVGLALVAGFWIGFLGDYPLTRDLYFTVAMLHVLAEAPFLLRML